MRLGGRLAAENDSHYHELYAPSRILRMILIFTRWSGVENDSHYQIVQMYSRLLKSGKIQPASVCELYPKPTSFRYKKRPKPTPRKNLAILA